MPMYFGLKNIKDVAERKRAIDGIVRLRAQLSKDLPQRTRQNSLMLATWNIRDFGARKLNPSPRLTESLYYMAEIISAFDLVAIQEVNENMENFNRLMDILGPAYSFIATDLCEGSAGNGERMAFVYDVGKVIFRNIAGEIVLPDKILIQGEKQFARTPYSVKFQSGWCRFTLNTVHLLFGEGKEGKIRRIEEIDKIAGFLAKRATRETENYILLGDMNIESPTDETMKALKKHEFVLPSELVKKKIPTEFLKRDATEIAAEIAEKEAEKDLTAEDLSEFATNMRKDRFYDQIAFFSTRNELELGGSRKNAGVFNFYDSVFREQDSEIYHPLASNRDKKNKKGELIWGTDETERREYFSKEWRTWQMSDHLPLWVELNIDFSAKYLKEISGI